MNRKLKRERKNLIIYGVIVVVGWIVWLRFIKKSAEGTSPVKNPTEQPRGFYLL